MKNQVKIAFSLIVLSTGLLFFQNCGKTTNVADYSSSLSSVVSNTPVITKTTGGGNVGYFKPATLSVVATGPNLKYQWYKDNTLVTGATEASLTISQAKNGDGGNYSVTVTNDSGVVTSPAIPVTLVRLPEQQGAPVIKASSGPQVYFQIGADGTYKPAQISVSATGVGLTYEWKLSYIDYTVSLSNTVATTKTVGTDPQITTLVSYYFYNNVKYNYSVAGHYIVTVKNYFGETTTADIAVDYPPIQTPTF